MNRRLIFSTIARYDLTNIYDGIAQFNVAAANRLKDRIRSSCRLLVVQPFVGSQYGEEFPGLRFLVVRKYVVYYRVYDDKIWIQRVIHSARDASGLL